MVSKLCILVIDHSRDRIRKTHLCSQRVLQPFCARKSGGSRIWPKKMSRKLNIKLKINSRKSEVDFISLTEQILGAIKAQIAN